MMRRLTLTTSLALALATAVAAQAQEVKFAFNGDLSASPSALSGKAGLVGIEQAIAEINEAGGVLGQQVSFTSRDDLSAPPKSIQNMSDLIDSEGATVVFGPTNSGNALAWKHIPNSKQVISMGCIGSGTSITLPVDGSDNYMFRTSMYDRGQVAAVLAYLAKAGKKDIGLLIESTGYGQNALEDIKAIAELQGLNIVMTENVGVNDTDVTSQLSKLQNAGVETLVIWAQGAAIAQTVRSMEKLQYAPFTMSSWAADNASYFNIVGPAQSHVPIFMRTVPNTYEGVLKDLYDKVSDKLPSQNSFPFAAHCYDAAHLMAKAIEQAGSTDGPAIKAALESLQGSYEGAIRTYEAPFTADDHEGLSPSDFRFARWDGDKMVDYTDDTISSLTPEDYKY